MIYRSRGAMGIVGTAFLAAGGQLVSFAGYAAETEPPSGGSAEPEATEAMEIVVTGSRIPTAIDKVAAKVTIVDAAQIDKAGVSTDVLDILRKTVPSFQGRGNAGNSNANNTHQNTAGRAESQLHNLDTLV